MLMLAWPAVADIHWRLPGTAMARYEIGLLPHSVQAQLDGSL
jgi:hypothetical protein